MTMLKIRGSNTDPDKERYRQALAPLADEFGQFEIEWLGNGGCSVESDDIPPDKMAAFAAAIKAALGANYRLTLTANF